VVAPSIPHAAYCVRAPARQPSRPFANILIPKEAPAESPISRRVDQSLARGGSAPRGATGFLSPSKIRPDACQTSVSRWCPNKTVESQCEAWPGGASVCCATSAQAGGDARAPTLKAFPSANKTGRTAFPFPLQFTTTYERATGSLAGGGRARNTTMMLLLTGYYWPTTAFCCPCSFHHQSKPRISLNHREPENRLFFLQSLRHSTDIDAEAPARGFVPVVPSATTLRPSKKNCPLAACLTLICSVSRIPS